LSDAPIVGPVELLSELVRYGQEVPVPGFDTLAIVPAKLLDLARRTLDRLKAAETVPDPLPVEIPPGHDPLPAELEGLELRPDFHASHRFLRDVPPFRLLVWRDTPGNWHVVLADCNRSDHWLRHAEMSSDTNIRRIVTDTVNALKFVDYALSCRCSWMDAETPPVPPLEGETKA